MPIDPETAPATDAALAVPGVLCVCPSGSGAKLVFTGPAAGWFLPRGIGGWERELSFVARAELTSDLARTLRATLPHEQIPPKKLPGALRAAETCSFLPVTSDLVADLRKQGLRVHTVGVDRVSAGFYYFEEGGPVADVRVEGNLVEMLAISLGPSATNADIADLQEGLIDRLLIQLSGGLVTELDVELADAMPRLSRDGTGLVGTSLEAFEEELHGLADAGESWSKGARELADALAAADRNGERSARVPLYDQARAHVDEPLDVQIGPMALTLPARARWTVKGEPHAGVASPVASSVAPPPVVTAVASEPRAPEPAPVAEASASPAPARVAREEGSKIAPVAAAAASAAAQPAPTAPQEVEAAAPASGQTDEASHAPEPAPTKARSKSMTSDRPRASISERVRAPKKSNSFPLILMLVVLAAAMAYFGWLR